MECWEAPQKIFLMELVGFASSFPAHWFLELASIAGAACHSLLPVF